MKKIAFVMPHYSFPTPAIAGGAVEELITMLIDENEKQNDFKFFILQPEFNKNQKKALQSFVYKNTELISCKNNKFFSLFSRGLNKIFKLLKLKKRVNTTYENNIFKQLKKINPDKVIFEGAGFASTDKLAKIVNRKDVYFHFHSQFTEKSNFYKNIGNIIGVSRFITKDWESWLDSNKIDDVKIFTLLNCINENKFEKTLNRDEKLTLRKSLGFSPNDFIIIYCGRFIKEKGILELLKAVEKTPNNIKLLLVGSVNFSRNEKSSYNDEIVKLVKNNKNKIFMTGFISNTDIYKYYQIANLHIVPSIWEEACSLVVIEGITNGLPQILTNSGGTPELASKEGSIIITRDDLEKNLYTTIMRLYDDENKLKQMAEANLKHKNDFSREKYYKNFKELMEK